MRPIEAVSKERWRASAAQKRIYGGSTVTKFWVRFAGDPESQLEVTGYGPTPGERATDAKRRFLQAKGILPCS